MRLVKLICSSLFIKTALPVILIWVLFRPFSRSNEASGGVEETGGASEPGAAEAKADRDEVCFLSLYIRTE